MEASRFAIFVHTSFGSRLGRTRQGWNVLPHLFSIIGIKVVRIDENQNEAPDSLEAYLAGPDVFFADALDIAKKKKATLAEFGIIGHFPLDNEVPKELFEAPNRAAAHIAKANENMMCRIFHQVGIGIIFANMTPYHGPSMDVGTAFEVGFVSALAETNPNIIILGYTDDKRTFEARVIDEIYGGSASVDEETGGLRGSDGMLIEAFGLADNLMIIHAIEKTGGLISHSLEEAASLARNLVTDRMKK